MKKLLRDPVKIEVGHVHTPVVVHRLGGQDADVENWCGSCGEKIWKFTGETEWRSGLERSLDPPKPAEPNRVNVYTCDKCGGYTVTIDIHEGVTPFMILCRASGQEASCDGTAYSAMYPKGPRPEHIPEPAWEWYRPTHSEYTKLSEEMRDHVDKGGLDLRRRSYV